MKQETRNAAWAIANGYCRACGKALGAEGVVHHRKLRSQGGTDDLGNLVVIHANPCHTAIHANPLAARDAGLIVSAYADPLDIPIGRLRLPG
jgi:hypothetical protein